MNESDSILRELLEQGYVTIHDLSPEELEQVGEFQNLTSEDEQKLRDVQHVLAEFLYETSMLPIKRGSLEEIILAKGASVFAAEVSRTESFARLSSVAQKKLLAVVRRIGEQAALLRASHTIALKPAYRSENPEAPWDKRLAENLAQFGFQDVDIQSVLSAVKQHEAP